MPLSDISTILWRERHLFELLLYKLDVERALLAADQTRWLPYATREVEALLDEVRDVELVRAMEVDSLATELGLPANASLRQLASAAPAPWGPLFDEHRSALLALTEEIVDVAEANRNLLEEVRS